MPTTFDSADDDVALWLASLRAAGRSPVTVTGYAHTTAHYLTWLERPASTGTRLDAMRYIEHLRARMKPASVAHHVRALRALYGFLVAEEIVVTNPFARMKLSVPETVKDTPSTAEVEAMPPIPGNSPDLITEIPHP